jgi:hypothetical protein
MATDGPASAGAGDGEVHTFVREWLGPLIDYDAANRSDLVATLWQYYECGGNDEATARADAAVLDLLRRLLAGTPLEVAGEGTNHALLTQTDDHRVGAPRADSREVGSGVAHPTERTCWSRRRRVRVPGVARDRAERAR